MDAADNDCKDNENNTEDDNAVHSTNFFLFIFCIYVFFDWSELIII